MSRFANEEAASRPSFSPTPTAHENPSTNTTRDVEAGHPNNGYNWLRRSKKPSDKPKSEKAEEVETVEEVDGVWGKLGDGAPNYKNVGW